MKSFVIFIWLWISLPALAGTQIAVTIDDLPRQADAPKGITRLQIANQILDVLDRHHLSGVYGFVNGERLSDTSDGAQILRDWVRRGQFLGNHSYSHADLNKTNVKDYEADILKNEQTLKTYFPNGDFKWFRYPFLNEGLTLEKREAVAHRFPSRRRGSRSAFPDQTGRSF